MQSKKTNWVVLLEVLYLYFLLVFCLAFKSIQCLFNCLFTAALIYNPWKPISTEASQLKCMCVEWAANNLCVEWVNKQPNWVCVCEEVDQLCLRWDFSWDIENYFHYFFMFMDCRENNNFFIGMVHCGTNKKIMISLVTQKCYSIKRLGKWWFSDLWRKGRHSFMSLKIVNEVYRNQ